MARIAVVGSEIVVLLNPVERLLAFRRRPRALMSQVVSVTLLDSTAPSVVDSVVTLGFAARTAPGRGLATVGPRCRGRDGRPAMVVTYGSGPGVLVRFRSEARWSLYLVSSRLAADIAGRLRDAIPRP
ncbi:hypothetical protein [Kineosporia sp. A_224]|uniref:hypothetical protein n=1 Tax=Kineosporia sp. A_224 TaxID=1962180 RepID=UPI001179E56C|nr:hypothetical protein [Kineosporia sp. A_224]